MEAVALGSYRVEQWAGHIGEELTSASAREGVAMHRTVGTSY